KISAYVRDRQLFTSSQFLDLGEISIEDSAYFNLEISNAGIYDLSIENIFSVEGNILFNTPLPMNLPGMSKFDLPLTFIPDELGAVEDTLVIISNDPINPEYKIPFAAFVKKYFLVVDNDDAGIYSETGTWFTSVTQAYGESSRYALIQSTPNGPAATFTFELRKNGIYDILEILPETVNSADNALYKIISDGIVIDSLYLDQNQGSGNWKNIGQYFLKADVPTSIKVIDTGESTVGPVIRADAFKIALVEETTNIDDSNLSLLPDEFELYQNYPNPFNPSTRLKYAVGSQEFVSLKIFDILGNELATLVSETQPPGIYEMTWDADHIPSGIYFYQLRAGKYSVTKKMILIR
ncbi:MAG: T9SS type A sorting domain-containing protein, partial [Ignavibacteriaceae bacterium]